MVTYDNNGKKIAEQTYAVTSDGTVINTNTVFYNDHPVFQHISTRTREGKVKDIDVFNGKILP
jgi:hypothetical protein